MFDELDEIWSLYAEDGLQSLDASEISLQQIARIPEDAEAIALFFRSIHTFKGNARVLGLFNIETCAHNAEELIGLVRDEGVPMDGDIRALLLESVDALRGMLEISSKTRADVVVGNSGDEDLSSRILAKIAACRGRGAESPAPVAAMPAGETADGVAVKEPADTLGAIVFTPPENSLADDPVYREVFAGVVHEVLAEMRQALGVFEGNPSAAQTVFRSEAERLGFAAKQISIPEWPEVLQAFLARSSTTVEVANALITQIEALAKRDLSVVRIVEVPGEAEQVRSFFVLLAPLLSALFAIDARFTHGDTLDGEEIRQIADELRTLAENSGFARLAAIAGQLTTSLEPQAFIAAELALYEALALLEQSVSNGEESGAKDYISPSHALQNWCADRIFETLLELRNHFDQIKKQAHVCDACSRVTLLMRQVYHTCRHFGLDTAAHLTMSLTDLFIRVREGEMQLDPVLLHIARSFVGDMEAVFDTVSEGTTPDMSRIERLFDEAAKVAFTASSAVPSASIEARLGLPKVFHKVLTPESCKDAVAAMDAGKRFYILRTDLNTDDETTTRFLEWINTGIAHAISNVTVFQGDTTLFDFLLATDLDETRLNDALAILDPPGNRLIIETALHDRRATNRKPPTIAGSATAEGAPDAQVSAEGVIPHDSPFLRIPADSVDRLMDMVGELSLIVQETIHSPDLAGLDLEAFDKTAHRLKMILREVQDATAELRMVPIGGLFQRLRRTVRMLEQQTGKNIHFVLRGGLTPIDKAVADRLYEPLMHVVRNAADHGLETTPEERLSASKPETGEIVFSAKQEGTHVKIDITDDGRGLNRERILERARERGLVGADEEPEDSALWPVIFEPGFSTADAVTSLSGRGVGMDVLNTTLRELRGSVGVESKAGKGTRITLAVPVTLAFLECLIIWHGNRFYAVPIDQVESIFRPKTAQIIPVTADSVGEMVRLHDNLVSIHRLEDFYGEKKATSKPLNETLVVVFRTNDRLAGLPVDEIHGQQQVFMKPLPRQLANIRAGIGSAILSTGEIALVLNCEALIIRENIRGR